MSGDISINISLIAKEANHHIVIPLVRHELC